MTKRSWESRQHATTSTPSFYGRRGSRRVLLLKRASPYITSSSPTWPPGLQSCLGDASRALVPHIRAKFRVVFVTQVGYPRSLTRGGSRTNQHLSVHRRCVGGGQFRPGNRRSICSGGMIDRRAMDVYWPRDASDGTRVPSTALLRNQPVDLYSIRNEVKATITIQTREVLPLFGVTVQSENPPSIVEKITS